MTNIELLGLLLALSLAVLLALAAGILALAAGILAKRRESRSRPPRSSAAESP